MIVNNGKYYLYRHIRLDTDVPFYVGIGTKPNKYRKHNREYCRAYSKTRNKIWWDIVKKTDYSIEIILESNDYEFIKNKEIEFTSLYGRIDLKTGTLAGLTNGGQGNTGYIVSEETKRKIGENNSSKGKFGKNHHRSKKAYQYDFNGNFIKEWDSLSDIARYFNTTELPEKCVSGRTQTYKGYRWFYSYLGLKIEPLHSKEVTSSKVVLMVDLSTNLVLDEFENLVAAAKHIKNHSPNIAKVCNGLRNKCGGYKWKFK